MSAAAWSLLVVVGVPAIVIALTELDERLRQRDSPLRAPLEIIRLWALPLFAVWAILRPVLDLPADSLIVRVISSALVLSLAIAALRLLGIMVDGLRGRPRSDGSGPIPQLVLALPRIVVLLVLAWALLAGVWGVDLSAALTALGVTSLVVSFALQDTLSGLASGFLLLSDQPFQPGDWIEVEDNEGLVVDLNWRTTRIRTRDGDLIIVPNSSLAQASIVNFSAPEPLHRVVYTVQVAFVNPPTVAKNMLLDAARGTPGVLEDPPPRVKVVQTDDPLMTYDVDMWISDYAIAPQVKSDFGSLVWYQSERQGVPLPSPAQDLFLHDPIAEANAAETSPATVRRALRSSSLLAMLDDEDLDRLIPSSRITRFAAGELLIDMSSSTRDLLVIVDGVARMVLIEADGSETGMGEVGSGETLGVLDSSRGDGAVLGFRAATDCEVVIVQAEAAGEVGSRNADLSAALNRLASLRRRRIERTLTQRTRASDDETAETTS